MGVLYVVVKILYSRLIQIINHFYNRYNSLTKGIKYITYCQPSQHTTELTPKTGVDSNGLANNSINQLCLDCAPSNQMCLGKDLASSNRKQKEKERDKEKIEGKRERWRE